MLTVLDHPGLGHEIGNLKDKDYFIWEMSLHFAGD